MTMQDYTTSTPVEPTYTAEFTYSVEGVRTVTIGDKTNVVTSVTIQITGTDGKTSFSLPHSVELDAPGDSFIAFENLSEADVTSWALQKIENLIAIKSHIQLVINREKIKSASEVARMPWLPAVEPQQPEAA